MAEFVDKISEAIQRNSFGIYVGAGISIGAGLPSWGEMLEELINDVKDKNTASNDKIEELKKLSVDPNKYLMVAEELREIIPAGLERYIRDKFDSNSIKPTCTHDKLVKLKSKFIITTNYDTLIEKAFVKNHGEYYPKVFSYKDASSISYNLWNDDHFILKAHGDSRNSPNEIVLTEMDYRKIIYHQQGYQSVLHAIFSTNTLLFLGVSLNDPELLLLLGYIHNIFHGGSPIHYALIPKDKLSKTEIDRWRKDFNIECVEYDSKENHKELEIILETILEKSGELVIK